MSSILRGSRKFILGLGLAGCGAAAGVILGMKEVDENTMKRMRRGFVAAAAEFLPSSANFAFSKDWKESEPSKAPFPLSYKGNVLPLHHGIKWDENWDYRQPEFLLKPLKGKFGSPSTDSDNDFNEKLEKAKATASRHLILVRHGQYNLDGKTDQDRYLTDLGREQARLTGLRLKELNLPYTKMVKSTMTRATETANIIGKELPQDLETSSCDFLREGAPIQPEPPVGHWRPEAKVSILSLFNSVPETNPCCLLVTRSSMRMELESKQLFEGTSIAQTLNRKRIPTK